MIRAAIHWVSHSSLLHAGLISIGRGLLAASVVSARWGGGGGFGVGALVTSAETGSVVGVFAVLRATRRSTIHGETDRVVNPAAGKDLLRH